MKLFFLWLIDRWLTSIFCCNQVDENIGLPEKLKNISKEQYEAAINRISAFRESAKNGQTCEIRLTEIDINSLYHKYYEAYKKLLIKDKLNVTLFYYEIQNNKLIWNHINFFNYFFHGKILYTKTEVKLTLRDGFVHELHSSIMFFNKELPSSRLGSSTGSSLNSGIVDLVLSLRHDFYFVSSNDYDQNEIEQALLEQESIKSMIRQIKSLEIRDGELILRV